MLLKSTVIEVKEIHEQNSLPIKSISNQIKWLARALPFTKSNNLIFPQQPWKTRETRHELVGELTCDLE